MSNARIILPAAVALVLGAAACTDTTEPPEQLTEEEARDLLDGYRTLQTLTDPDVVSESEDGAVIACPLGGQAEFTGTAGEEFAGDTARINLDIRVNPMGCGVSGNGTEFTLTGDPSVREEITVEIVGFFESFDISGGTVGTLAWELGDRSGTCDIDLELGAEPDLSNPTDPGVNGTLSGMLCGHEVSIDVAELPIE